MPMPPAREHSGPSSVGLAAIAVGLLVCLVFVPVLGTGFVNWDDPSYVQRDGLGQALRAAFTTIHVSGNWHPLTTLSHAVDHAVWGLWPAGHHLTNLALHSINAGLVVLLAHALWRASGRRLGRPALLAAAATGLLWGLHPLRVESVAWVSERKDLLCALGYILGLLSYLRYATAAQARWYVGAIVGLVLALLAKPMAVSFPLVLLALDAYPLRRLRRPALARVLVEKLPFALLAAVAALVTLHAQRSAGAMRALAGVPLGTRVLVAVQSTVAYLGKTLLPCELRALYAYPQDVTWSEWRFLLPLCVLGLLLGAALQVRRRLPIVAVALATYLALLSPVLGIVQVGPQAMAERYTYLPGIPLALLFGAVLGGLAQGAGTARRRAMTAVLAVMLAGLGALSVRQIAVWQDSGTLWSNVIDLEPGNTEAHNNRADFHYQRGELYDALADYSAALASFPAVGPRHASKRRAAFFNDRAVTYVQLGQLAAAVADETEAIRLRPNQADYYLNRARMFRLMGRLDEARADLERARTGGQTAAASP